MKSYNLQLRLSPHEVEAYHRAATKQALPLTAWVRSVSTKAAAEQLGQSVESLVPRESPHFPTAKKIRRKKRP